ncbi:helix-turn-helix transcriptional regulator [Roseicyclus persicicus]|uniref:AlpA family phage regulatory protein n=1 Tax=Roseicyclus persicicus TaxID=2650661 RepID=A0A7X6JYV2_9RHOB|nr:AlpA family phage regulatory protein [Roseibacterium persicicum]NKX44879.1 AlpA family phage regulatory protein [Roseibacterium persicicum]
MRLLDFNRLRQTLGGRSRSSVYRDIEAGRLPQPLRLGGRLYWVEAEVHAYLEELADVG